MQDSTIVVLFAVLALAVGYGANVLSAQQSSIGRKRLIIAARDILLAATLIACGFVLSGGDESIWGVAAIFAVFLIVKFKRTRFCPTCGTRNTTKFAVPNDVCRKCGARL